MVGVDEAHLRHGGAEVLDDPVEGPRVVPQVPQQQTPEGPPQEGGQGRTREPRVEVPVELQDLQLPALEGDKGDGFVRHLC